MERAVINEEVTISSVYFKNKQGLEAFPKQMEFAGDTYTFLNDGWRFLITKGQEVVRIFTVSDGANDFRLKLEPSRSRWTLLDIKPSGSA